MTFLLPFGEMTMTPDDAKQIIGLALEGKVVFEGFNNFIPFEELFFLAKYFLGWEKLEAEEEFEIGGGAMPKDKRSFSVPGERLETINMTRKINMVRLREKFEDSGSKTVSGKVVMDRARSRHTSISYLLHSLGTVFFPDFSGNKVNACYLQWLKTLSLDPETNEVPRYSWGTALLASVMENLCKASRWNITQIIGCVARIQNWALEKPTGGRYPFRGTQHKAKEMEMVDMRKKLDALTIDDVVFDPYLKLDEDGEDEVGDRVFSDVATYVGPLFHSTGFIILDPRRTLRQIGNVQRILPEDSRFKLSVDNSQFKDKNVRLTYEPAPSIDHWNARSEGVNQISRRALETSHGTSVADENYMEWYQDLSHPYVENLDPEARKHFKKGESLKSRTSRNEESD
ncbi:protein MAIN-LIKE 1-like [Papaver somniferum]|uniref:protein MAIN-LIKE 1-like n=1 Tax=Papaver somniferum TaxID=3469 RepID=UPI000E6FB03C|nr:protein MAIN-LIKE 1-like [Papaver somniferum]